MTTVSFGSEWERFGSLVMSPRQTALLVDMPKLDFGMTLALQDLNKSVATAFNPLFDELYKSLNQPIMEMQLHFAEMIRSGIAVKVTDVGENLRLPQISPDWTQRVQCADELGLLRVSTDDFTQKVSHALLSTIETVYAIALQQLAGAVSYTFFSKEMRDDLRRACIVFVLGKCSTEAVDAYNSAVHQLKVKATGYDQFVLSEMKTVCKELFGLALKGYNCSQIIGCLQEHGVSRQCYLKKGNLTRRGWVHFLSLEKPIKGDPAIIRERFGVFGMKLNMDHEKVIYLTDQELHDICDIFEALMFDAFVYWCFPDEMALTP